jgi:hypothetical protein
MARAACWVLIVALGATPDISHLFHFAFQQGQPADPEKSAPQGTIPPPTAQSSVEKKQDASAAAPHHSGRLSESSRLAIIRAISGEFVKAQIALPGGKNGLHLAANRPDVPPAEPAGPDNNAFVPSHVMIATRAPAIHAGDQVQITRIEFREKSIVFDLNGGGKRKWHLRDHLQIGVGGPIPTATVQPVQSGPAGLAEGQGSTLFLDFGRKVPDLSPDDLKRSLAPVLNFDSHRSAATQYAESLPPEFQKAIKNGIAAVGMDHDMVLAAMGRPDRKVRERDAEGNETEDWIYGIPPGKTVFVTFIGEKVVRVEQFN